MDANGIDRPGRVTASPAGRARFLRWLRTTHRWVGLWGAALGLLFGFSGFFLNHRAVLKIPGEHGEESTMQLTLPDRPPSTPEAMAAWLQPQLGFDRPATRVRRDPARAVAWGDRSVQQPENWTIVFSRPQRGAQATYWVGDRSVNVRRTDNALIATLTSLHKGTGLGVGWVLLVDTLAGSIILLSITGVVLWTQLSRRRVAGAAVIGTVLTVGLVLAWQSM